MEASRSPSVLRTPLGFSSPPPSSAKRTPRVNNLTFLSPSPRSDRLRPLGDGQENGTVTVTGDAPPSSWKGSRLRLSSLETSQTPSTFRTSKPDSVGDHSNSTLSAAKIHKLFSDFERQKELDDNKFLQRLRDVDEEKNRILGENEMLSFELDRLRQAESKSRTELDETKSRLAQLKKEIELLRKDEDIRFRNAVTELEEKKRALISSDAGRSKLEKEIEAARRYSSQLEKELESEKERVTLQMETFARRSVEKEKSIWEKEQSERRKQLEADMDSLRKKLYDAGTREMKLQQEADDVKRQLEKAKQDADRQLRAAHEESAQHRETLTEELKSTKILLGETEAIKRQLEVALQESRRLEDIAVNELNEERARTEETIQVSVRRALEKERDDKKMETDQLEKENHRLKTDLARITEDSRRRIQTLEEEKSTITASLNSSRQLIDELRENLDEAKKKESAKIDIACRRAVDKEKLVWEKQLTTQRSVLERENAELKSALAKNESILDKHERDLIEAKRLVERTKIEVERERDRVQHEFNSHAREFELKERDLKNELEFLKSRLVSSEESRKRAERESSEAQRMREAVEAEILVEREKLQSRIELAVKRAVEKDRLDQRAEWDAFLKEEERKRQSVEQERDDVLAKLRQIQSALLNTEKLLEEEKDEVRKIRIEWQNDRANLESSIESLSRRNEKDRTAWLHEKRDLEEKLLGLREAYEEAIAEHQALTLKYRELEHHADSLEERLNEATSREERMLEDMSQLRDKVRERSFMDGPGRKPFSVSENLPPPPPIPRISKPHAVSESGSSSLRPTSYLPPSRSVGGGIGLVKPSLRHSNGNRSTLSKRVTNAKKLLDEDWYI